MSNVLIGIIGVILFIGLALAGALILGEDFMGASASSKATAAISNGRQVMQAVAMHNLKTGAPLPYRRSDGSRTNLTDLTPRFLETASTPNNWHFHAAGSDIYAVADLPYTAENRAVCFEIQRQAGQISGDATDISETRLNAAQIMALPMGCTISAATGSDRYMVFVTS
ncbi:MAG: hypothetical protein CL472_08230 [Acidobacteria bacterium]|nr:hypothetical protein [Acidobacteriota bacterium]|tara:strand:- start:316 stop:822 length:507 start_codon:yes stop_codon:yes gene_type:complete